MYICVLMSIMFPVMRPVSMYLKFFKNFVHNKTLLLKNIHFSLLNELNIEVVATSNLVPA